MKKYFPLLVIASLLLVSCEKTVTEIEYRDKIHSWTQDSRMQYDMSLIINSHSTKEYLYLMGFYNYTKISTEDINHYGLEFDYSIDYKFPITDDYYIAANKESDYIVITPNDSPVSSTARKIFFMKSLDSLFVNFEFGHYTSGECIALSENDYCMIPYRIENGDGLGNMPKLLMLSLDIKENRPEVEIDTIHTKIIELGESVITNFVYNIISIEDRFLICCGSNTYHADTLGNVSIAYDGRINRYIVHDELYYAIGWGLNGDNFLKSSDKGKTWNEIGQIPNNFSSLNYISIGDSLIGYSNSQIFSVKISENGISSRELDNDGLEGKQITSISSFTDSLIYVTTLNGLFYNNKLDFFDSKIE